MKKTFASFIAVLTSFMFTTSCSNEIAEDANVITDQTVPVVFSVSRETPAAPTRTAIDGSVIKWQKNDAVTVWDGYEKNPFSVDPNYADQTFAILHGSVTSGANQFASVYPNSKGQNSTYNMPGWILLSTSITQKATPGSFDPAAALMTASASGDPTPTLFISNTRMCALSLN